MYKEKNEKFLITHTHSSRAAAVKALSTARQLQWLDDCLAYGRQFQRTTTATLLLNTKYSDAIQKYLQPAIYRWFRPRCEGVAGTDDKKP